MGTLALASLIIGCSEREDDNRGLRAALPFLGQTLIEYQVRQAAAAGASHVVVLVERLPAALVGAVDRLRRDGIVVELARSVEDAADRVHPDERLLMIGDGVVARQELVDKAARSDAPALFVLPDTDAEGANSARFERIDATDRWAGVATLDGTTLRRTVAMLGDWDLQSTLLRRIVQSDAQRVDVVPGSVWLVDRAEEGRAAETHLLGSAGADFLPASLSEAVTHFLLGRNIQPLWLRIGSVSLSALSVPAFSAGWVTTGALMLALAGPVAAIPKRMDGVALRAVRWSRIWRMARDLIAALSVGVLAWRLASDGAGWGVWVLAIALIALMGANSGQDRMVGHSFVNAPVMAGFFLPFAFFGYPIGGLAACAALAFGTLIVGQQILARKLRGRPIPIS